MRRVPLLVLALTACTTKTELVDECRLNSDCLAPLECVDGRCRPECREDIDCATGLECVANRCERVGPAVRVCTLARDCFSGETCLAGVCKPVGLLGEPDGGVAPPRDGGPGTTDGATGDGGGGPGTPDGGPQSGLQYGAPCQSDAQCASNICLGASGGVDGRCTRTCTQDPDCVLPDTCIAIAGQMLCGTSASVGGTGAPCPNGPDDCASGICLTIPNLGPLCTHECTPLPACPMNMTCQPVDDGQGGAVTVCIPGNGKGFGEACARAAECATMLCVGDPATGQGLCTSDCSQTSCPNGYACTQVSGGGAMASVCAQQTSAGGTNGGFGAPCTGASSCQSGLCLHNANTGQARCTRQCNSAADCAGVSCVALQSGIRVCGPL